MYCTSCCCSSSRAWTWTWSRMLALARHSSSPLARCTQISKSTFSFRFSWPTSRKTSPKWSSWSTQTWLWERCRLKGTLRTQLQNAFKRLSLAPRIAQFARIKWSRPGNFSVGMCSTSSALSSWFKAVAKIAPCAVKKSNTLAHPATRGTSKIKPGKTRLIGRDGLRKQGGQSSVCPSMKIWGILCLVKEDKEEMAGTETAETSKTTKIGCKGTYQTSATGSLESSLPSTTWTTTGLETSRTAIWSSRSREGSIGEITCQ